jgi:hypothetical protein
VFGGVERLGQGLELYPLLPQPTDDLNQITHQATQPTGGVHREHVARVQVGQACLQLRSSGRAVERSSGRAVVEPDSLPAKIRAEPAFFRASSTRRDFD